MKFHKNKFLTTGVAVALALAVGACSSSSSDDDEMTGTTPPVTPPVTTVPTPGPTDDQIAATQTALDAYPGAQRAHTAAKTAYDADKSEDNANALKMAAEALHAAATAVESAIAEGATDEQIAMFGETAVADAVAAVSSATTAVDAAAGMATTTAGMATTTAAGTKETAIATEAGQTTDAGLGGTDAPVTTTGQVEGEYNLAIKHGETSITVEGVTEDDNVQFMQAADLGKGRTMHSRMMEADDDGNVVEEVVIVSTDIEAPKATAFAMVTGQTLDVTTNTMNDSPAVTNEALAVDENSADVRALVMSSAFTAGTAAELTFIEDDTTTDDMDEAFETAGTYNGAMGTYRCNGNADCTVTLDDEGMITGMSDGWIFTPDEGATSDVPDADYLHYGFWLKKTTDKDGVLTYNEVETFSGSSVDASVGNDLNDVEGSASYDGDATGVYVKSVTNPDGTRASATSGHFTAAASLMVYFSGDDVAVNKQNTVTGTIDSFMLSGEEDNAWSVALKGERANGANMITGTANGGGAEGMFAGTFHGPTPLTPAEDDDNARVAPGSVVGEFGANFSNGSVAGGFGARKQ